MAQPNFFHLGYKFVGLEVHTHSGDRFKLVDRAARKAEAWAGELRDVRAAGRRERQQDERRLVAYAAGAVLVYDAHLRRVGVGLAGFRERVRVVRQLAAVESAEVDGHEPRSRLVVGHAPVHYAADELVELGLRVAASVAVFSR